MRYANKRAEALALMRQHIREEAKAGVRPAFLLHEIRLAVQALEQEAIIEFDMPGVRYWYHPESESYFATLPGEHMVPPDDTWVEEVMELTRWEYLGRQNIRPGVDSI